MGDFEYIFVFHFPYRKWVNVRVILMQTKRHLRDIRSDTNLAKLASLATHTQDCQVFKTISALMHRHRYNDRTWKTSKNRKNCYSLLTKNNMDHPSELAKSF